MSLDCTQSEKLQKWRENMSKMPDNEVEQWQDLNGAPQIFVRSH
jgi:hypothetical protein